jgi:dTDP-glucose pyrophosphorylase
VILIPAAGEGRRFRDAGYSEPKHLIPLLGAPMIERVIENVLPLDPIGVGMVATRDVVGKTKGAIDTILRAMARYETYDPHEKLVVANCDQLVRLPVPLPVTWGNGLIFTFKSANSAHSYVATDAAGKITGIVEKPTYIDPTWRAVSGVYAFTQADPFISACAAVFQEHGDAEQYVSAALSRMIDQGYALYAFDVPTAILGTPEDFQRFETAAEIARSLP